eukprot:TRINITY_DN36420_c0_g1_i1.p1 TRINITY_DN36420_c0_g1~~TRINITY_DN36420_c0_g1_i1.p1  ORF type:complete len:677 (+),score=53.24 TRINITY_DN36420_c0_g1_i1:299-2329(+)
MRNLQQILSLARSGNSRFVEFSLYKKTFLRFIVNGHDFFNVRNYGASESLDQLLYLQQQLLQRQEQGEFESGERTLRQPRQSITTQLQNRGTARRQRQQKIQDPMKRITLDLIESESMEEMIMILSSRRDQLDHIHLAAAFGRLVLLEQDHKGTAVNAQEIYNLLINKTMDKLTEFQPRQISQVVRSLGRYRGYKDREHIQHLCNAVLGLIEDLDSSNFANILQGLSYIRKFNDQQFLRVVVDVMTRKLDTFAVLDLSVILNALAKLDSQDSIPFFEASTYYVQLQMRYLSAAGLTGLASAYARVGVYDVALFDGITVNAIAKLRRFQPFNMTQLCTSYATLGRADRQLFDEVAKRSLHKVEEFSIFDISKLINAFSTVGFHNLELCEAFSQKLVNKIGDCRIAEVSALLQAFATARFYDPELISAAEYFVKGSFNDFRAEEIVKTCYMFSLFEAIDKQIVKILSQQAISGMDSLNFSQISNLLCSIALVEHWDEELVSGILFHLNKLCNQDGFQIDEDKAGQIYFSIRMGGEQIESQFKSQLPEELLIQGEKSWKETQRDNRKISNFQADVLVQLQKLLPEQNVLIDASIDDDLLIADFCIRYHNKDILVLLNDQSLFSVNEPYQALRFIGMRQKMLENRGFVVVNVPYYVWEELATPSDKQVFLEERFRGVRRA